MTELAALDIGIIVSYMIIVLIFGFLLRKRASSDIHSYFLGGRRIPWWILGASGMSSNFDITGTMLLVSLFYVIGIKEFWISARWCSLLAAFCMVFMGKWLRRSKVMTNAEWMEFRFGSGKGGEFARLITAIAVIVSSIGVIAYLSVGVGKFLSLYLPFSPKVCALMMIAVVTVYTVLGGLYSVAFTDLLQTILLSLVAIFLIVISFGQLGGLGGVIPTGWDSFVPAWKLSLPAEYSMYNMFTLCLLIWIVQGLTIGFGSTTTDVYTPQRFYAAKNEKEASLLAGEWAMLFTFRWPFALGLAGLALVGFAQVKDPELILPMVIGKYLPVGVRGLCLVGLLAASMSTFDSVLNASAAYGVRDIYQRFIRPDAEDKSLVNISRLLTVMVATTGAIIGLFIPTINVIWAWLTAGLGAGLAIPFVLRWYWWRFNGWGFGIGAMCGIVTATILGVFFSTIPLYVSYPIIVGIAFVSSVFGAVLTAPPSSETLKSFYKTTKPFGLWGPIRSKVGKDEVAQIAKEHRRDAINLCVAIPWQMGLYMFAMYLVIHKYSHMMGWLALVVVLSVVLYFNWYKKL